MQILDRRWPAYLAAALIYAAVMAGLWYAVNGFTEDFGVGFAIGGTVGLFLGVIGAGLAQRRRQEE